MSMGSSPSNSEIDRLLEIIHKVVDETTEIIGNLALGITPVLSNKEEVSTKESEDTSKFDSPLGNHLYNLSEKIGRNRDLIADMLKRLRI